MSRTGPIAAVSGMVGFLVGAGIAGFAATRVYLNTPGDVLYLLAFAILAAPVLAMLGMALAAAYAGINSSKTRNGVIIEDVIVDPNSAIETVASPTRWIVLILLGLVLLILSLLLDGYRIGDFAISQSP